MKESPDKHAKALKKISDWQIKHEKDDAKNFKTINDALAKLATIETMKVAVSEAVKTTVNGQIKGVSDKVDGIGNHLKKQDEQVELLSKQIAPWEKTRIFGMDAVKVVIYCGTFTAALSAIIGFLYLVGILKY